MTATAVRTEICDALQGVSRFPDCGRECSGTNPLESGLEHIGMPDVSFRLCGGDDVEHATKRKIREESA